MTTACNCSKITWICICWVS